MTKTVSPFRRFIYAFILGVAVNASFAQTVTQQSTVIISKTPSSFRARRGFTGMTIGDIKHRKSHRTFGIGTVEISRSLNLGDKLRVLRRVIVHVDAVQFDNRRTFCIKFDSDPVEAAAQRKSIFAGRRQEPIFARFRSCVVSGSRAGTKGRRSLSVDSAGIYERRVEAGVTAKPR